MMCFVGILFILNCKLDRAVILDSIFHKISKNDDESWICALRIKTGLGQNERMAISQSERSPIRVESQVVQKAGLNLSKRIHKTEPGIKIQSLIEERYTWPVCAVL